MTAARPPAPTLPALAGESLKIGLLSFGGPAGQIALMHRVFIEERKWIDEASYLHALNYCMLLPGPEAQQLATYVGWRLRGVAGGIIAGALFVAPGAAIILAISWAYAVYGATPALAAAFFGVKAAVIAFIVEAMTKIGRRALKTRIDLAVALAAFFALSLFGAPFPLVILTAMAAGFLLAGKTPATAGDTQAPSIDRANGKIGWRTPAACAALWLTPLAAAFIILGPDHLLTKVGVLFAALAVVTFGGAYAVLAFLTQQAVEAQGWLSAAQMIDGLGLAETTPGPLVLVNQFVGFLAGWQAEGGGFMLAVAAAVMASWQTFAPSFLWIFAGAPFADTLRAEPRAAGALKLVTAAVLGVIAAIAFWFATHALFAEAVAVGTPWGHMLRAPVPASLDPAGAIIAAAAALALIRYRASPVLVVVAAALAGVAARALGG